MKVKFQFTVILSCSGKFKSVILLFMRFERHVEKIRHTPTYLCVWFNEWDLVYFKVNLDFKISAKQIFCVFEVLRIKIAKHIFFNICKTSCFQDQRSTISLTSIIILLFLSNELQTSKI